MLAPIILFTYSRPKHTQHILDSLAGNREAGDSILYIFCDGPKKGCSKETLEKIQAVRSICQKEQRFKSVKVIVQPENRGLANSIISGVTEVINIHGTAIVLEDDLVLSPYFLYYMNDSLARYENNSAIGQIGACNFFACGSKFPDTFFIPIPDCLGWATWKDRWEKFNPDAAGLLALLEKNSEKKRVFNAYDSFDFMNMLELQSKGKVNSWAVRWQAVCALNGWKTLYPNLSMSNHVESSDEDATHANLNILPPLQIEKPILETIDCVENPAVIKAMKLGYSGKGDYYGKRKKPSPLAIKNYVKAKAKRGIIKFVPLPVKRFIKKLYQNNREKEMWSGSYVSWDEAKSRCTGYDEKIILEKCRSSLLQVKNGEAAYERDSVVFDKIQYSWSLLAGLQKAAIENGENLCVLDFGGSLGSTYYQNREFLSGIKQLDWCIVEQPHFVDCGKQDFENNQLHFFYTIEECMKSHKPNVLLLSGVLPYLKAPYDWIEKFVHLGIPYIIIDRTAVTESKEDILTIQKVPEVIYPASYPCWFFNEERLLEKVSPKYQLIADDVDFLNTKAVVNSLNAQWKIFILGKRNND